MAALEGQPDSVMRDRDTVKRQRDTVIQQQNHTIQAGNRVVIQLEGNFEGLYGHRGTAELWTNKHTGGMDNFAYV